MATPLWPDDSMFQHFTVFEETFKTINSLEIKTAILVPKGLKPGPHPVIFNIHGGFLIYAHSLFAPFFAPWVLKLALENSAVVVSPDYRLLPSTNDVADVLEDLEDFWQWSRSNLPEVLEHHASGYLIDFSRLLLTGSSAGGYGAIQLALSHPNDTSAVAVAYPLVDPEDPIFVSGPAVGEPTVLRFPAEDIPSKNSVIEWVEKARKTVKTKAGFERMPFAIGVTQHGLFSSTIFDSKGLKSPEYSPLERVKAGAKLPKKVWILHGNDDTVVHIRGSDKFVDLVREKLSDTTVRYDIAQGEDHAFDLIKTFWELHAPGALDFVRKSWLEG